MSQVNHYYVLEVKHFVHTQNGPREIAEDSFTVKTDSLQLELGSQQLTNLAARTSCNILADTVKNLTQQKNWKIL